jgi:ribulose-5-phosphate 4-epimerase/fuculose-1-phosphate aldolase
MNKVIHIIGGGTISHVASHLALCAPAYGQVGRKIRDILVAHPNNKMDVQLHLTKMAGGDRLETNEDIKDLLGHLVQDASTKMIIMTAAIVDFNGEPYGMTATKYNYRMSSAEKKLLELWPAPKLLTTIRQTRKDIFLIAFKASAGLNDDLQYRRGLKLLKESSANLVLANDVCTHRNMIIVPEEAKYCLTKDRDQVLNELVDMALLRSNLTFTRSTVVDGQPISWNSELVPETLRIVVDHCIKQGAYKPFRGATAGHFACKVDENTFLTSIRKSDFNELDRVGLVKVVTDGPDSVLAYGAKPSVGGQSQRIVFHDHKNYDCIVHFHAPIRSTSLVPIATQREFECGSHQCGKNTSDHLEQFGNLSAVYLDEHGPNIVFNRSIDPNEVIKFIDENFDLSQKTGGYITESGHFLGEL